MSLRRVSLALVLLAVAGAGIGVDRFVSPPIVLPIVPGPGLPPVTVDLLTLAGHHQEYQGKQVIVTGWLVAQEQMVFMQTGPWRLHVVWLSPADNRIALESLFRAGEVYVTLQGRFDAEGQGSEFTLAGAKVLSVDPSRPKPMPVDAGYPSPMKSYPKTR